MGSSVSLCAVCGLWKTFECKTGILTTTPRKFAFLGDNLFINLCCDVHCQLLQMILVEVKTTGYQT